MRVSIPAMVALVLVLISGTATAAPAPWYQWRSLGNGAEVCARASPGAGWTRGDGPFVEAGCTRPLRVIRL